MKSMTIRLLVLFASIMAAVTAIDVERTHAQSDTLPPGIEADSWIRLSDSAGIVVSGVRVGSAARLMVDPGDPAASVPPTIINLPPTKLASGALMGKLNGEWIVIEELMSPGPNYRQVQ